MSYVAHGDKFISVRDGLRSVAGDASEQDVATLEAAWEASGVGQCSLRVVLENCLHGQPPWAAALVVDGAVVHESWHHTKDGAKVAVFEAFQKRILGRILRSRDPGQAAPLACEDDIGRVDPLGVKE